MNELTEKLLEIIWKRYQETGDETHHKNWQDLKDGVKKPFECANGHTYLFPSKHCVFCKYCKDLLYDYTNGPYMFFCDLGCEDGHESCGKFEEEPDVQKAN